MKQTIKDVAALAADAITGAVWFVRAAVVFVFEFFANQWRQYNAFGQALFLAALVALSVDVGVSYHYGLAQTTLHAWGFAVLAFAFCVLPDAAVTEGRKGNSGGAWSLAAASLIIGAVVAYSHLAYSGNIRLSAMADHGFSVKKAADVRKGADSEEATIETLRVGLATATKERDELKKANPWLTATTAPALEAEIANFEGDFIFKRSKACADVTLPESRAFCDKVKDARGRLAAIKQANAAADRADGLQARIERAQERLDARTAKAAVTKPDNNVIVNQNDLAAVFVNWWSGLRGEEAIEPTNVQRTVANIAIVGLNTLGFLIAAPILMIAAGFNRVSGALGGHGGGGGGVPRPVPSSAPAITPVAANANWQNQPAGIHPDTTAALAARRHQVTERLVTMRQSRVDGGLLSRAV